MFLKIRSRPFFYFVYILKKHVFFDGKLIFCCQYMATDGNNIKQELSKVFCCEICHYTTKRKSNLTNHLNSARHKMATDGNNIKQELSNNFVCEICNKTYKDRTGLWKHNKKCNTETIIPDEISDKELIIMLIKQNTELAKELETFQKLLPLEKNKL